MEGIQGSIQPRLDVLHNRKFQNKPFVTSNPFTSGYNDTKVYNLLNMGNGRFVLLKHDVETKSDRQSHWDLMLEWENELLSFELKRLPDEGVDTFVTRLPNHRKVYLDFEGAISGNRGIVHREAAGDYDVRCFEDRIELRLNSERLNARVAFPTENGSWYAVGREMRIRIEVWEFRMLEQDI